MKYTAVFRDMERLDNKHLEFVHKHLQNELFSAIGGLEQFYGKPIVLTLNYETKRLPIHPLDNSIEHYLTAEISTVQFNKVEFVNPPKFEPISKKYTRWERLKQFVKGE